MTTNHESRPARGVMTPDDSHEVLSAFDLPSYIGTRYGLKVQRTGTDSARCVAAWRDGERDSVSLYREAGKWRWRDHAGDIQGDAIDFLCQVEGLNVRDAWNTAREHAGMARVVPMAPPIKKSTYYVYQGADGAALFRVVRVVPGKHGGKDFYQQRPDPAARDGWAPGVRGVPQGVPYHLPELAAALEVYIVEGEKDADRLRDAGIVATCNAGGAGKWRPEHARHLAGKAVVILGDNDDAGRAHVAQVVATLRGVAASIRVPELPGLPPKGDVSDWLDMGHTVSELRELAEWTPELGDEPQGDAAPLEAPAEAWPELDPLPPSGPVPYTRANGEPVQWKHPGGGAPIPDLRAIADDELARLARSLERDHDGDEKANAYALGALRAEQAARETARVYGLDLRGSVYRIGAGGVQVNQGKTTRTLCMGPIWVAGLGRDLATGAHMVNLKWCDEFNAPQSAWLHSHDLSNKEALIGEGAASRGLYGLPIGTGSANALSQWLVDASRCLVTPLDARTLTSRLGWLDAPDGRRFITPEDETVTYTGRAEPARGSVEGWARGLRAIAALDGDDTPHRLAALVVLCAAAAAPLSQGVATRNPVFGLTTSSSTGKGTVMRYALAMWGDPNEGTYMAMQSTAKGLEDRAVSRPHLPLFIDDAQEAYNSDPGKVQGWIYFLANRQTRTTSSRAQKVTGGKEWPGVGFYATERSIAHELARGANWRVIELHASPLPAGRDDLVEALQAAVRDHAGALRQALALELADGGALTDDARALARELRQAYPELKGDDPQAIALVGMGAHLLARVTGTPIDGDGLTRWLAAYVANLRENTPDASIVAFEALMDFVTGATWNEGTPDLSTSRAVWETQAGVVAWRYRDHYDINHRHPLIEQAMRPHRGLDSHKAAWARLGLIKTEGTHLFCKKRGEQGRVMRVPVEWPQIVAARGVFDA